MSVLNLLNNFRRLKGGIARQWFSLYAQFLLAMHGATVGPNLKVRGRLDMYIHPLGTVNIGPDCRIKSGFAENAVGGYRRMALWVGPHAVLTIGSSVGMSNSTIACANAISIGDDVFIGGGCNIYDTDFHSIDIESRLSKPDIRVKTAPITIGHRSFIGGHCTILKGVVIGEEAVVGAGSVVSRSIPSGEIWAGNPARFLKKIKNITVTVQCNI
jgi:acetyltransferase-like isoleucine patch superfamily enzyme